MIGFLGKLKLLCIGTAIGSTVVVRAEGLASYAPVDVIGRGLAATLDNETQQAIRAYGRDGIFWGITGTLKPHAKVTYKAGDLKDVAVQGSSGRGAEFKLIVVASATLDVGPGKLAKKVAKVTTIQELVIRFLPTVKNNHKGIVGEAEVISATATKEGLAHQAHAEKLRDNVRAELVRQINDRLRFVPMN